MGIFVCGELPGSRRTKPLRLSDEKAAMVEKKVDGMVNRSYLQRGFVKSTLHYFANPKGPTDVQIVYDGTSCGLNKALWAPNFYLPTARAAALLLSVNTWILIWISVKCSITLPWTNESENIRMLTWGTFENVQPMIPRASALVLTLHGNEVKPVQRSPSLLLGRGVCSGQSIIGHQPHAI
jgi:hypothetical protein